MRLFDNNGKLTDHGSTLDDELQAAIAPILLRAKEAGYDLRDAGYVAISAATEAHLDVMLLLKQPGN